MKLVRGTNVYPRAIEAIVRGATSIDEFQIHLYTADGITRRDRGARRVPDARRSGDALLDRAGKRELAEAHEGLRIGVRLAEHESLPRFELKAKRLVDERDRLGIARATGR